MLVAVAVFSIVMMVGVSTLLAMVDANRKAQAIKSVMNNLNFALENMSRTIRTGTTYHCSTSATPPASASVAQDCANGGLLLAFERQGGSSGNPNDQVMYRINSTTQQLERSTNSGASFTAITATEVDISDFKVYVVGSSGADSLQPRVVISVSGTAGVSEKVRTDFKVQTAVSQRFLDLE